MSKFFNQVCASVDPVGRANIAKHLARKARTAWIARSTASVRTAENADPTTVTADARRDGPELDAPKVGSENFFVIYITLIK